MEIGNYYHVDEFIKEYISNNKILGLNLGCGDLLFIKSYQNSMFLHCDSEVLRVGEKCSKEGLITQIIIEEKPIYYFQYDLRNPLPFKKNMFKYIFMEHLIEHIEFEDAYKLLDQCYHLLKSDGALRMSTPDLSLFLNGYTNPDNQFLKEHGKHLLNGFGINNEWLFRSDSKDWLDIRNSIIYDLVKDADVGFSIEKLESIELKEKLHEYVSRAVKRPAWMINQLFNKYGHKYIYDFQEMTFLAKKSGFMEENIFLSSFRNGRYEDLCGLDMDARKDESLYVELIK